MKFSLRGKISVFKELTSQERSYELVAKGRKLSKLKKSKHLTKPYKSYLQDKKASVESIPKSDDFYKIFPVPWWDGIKIVKKKRRRKKLNK